MKFVSWNVNGIRACLKHGFLDIFNKLDADIFAIQETKCQQGQVSIDTFGYYQYYNYAVRKGYSGTAVFTKVKPKRVIRHMWSQTEQNNNETINIIDNEGRILALEFDKFWFVCVYTPNAQKELIRITPRLVWGKRFTSFCKNLENGNISILLNDSKNSNVASDVFEKKPVIMCGDFNVAHEEIDLKNPKQNVGNAGFSAEERKDFSNLLNIGFTDSFRFLYPNKTDSYTWWSYRAKARERNVGWRIDYFLVSNSVSNQIVDSVINNEIYGSDHCPITLDIII